MKRTLIILLLLALALSLTACGGDGGSKTSSESPSPAESSKTSSDEARSDETIYYSIGEYAKTEHYEVAIVKVTKPTEWKFKPEEGKEYVAVEISVKNISDENGSVKQSGFQYKGEDGKLHGRYPDTYSGFGVEPDTFGAEDIEIGQTFNGTIVYLMPESMKEVELWFRESYTTTPDAAFKFSK